MVRQGSAKPSFPGSNPGVTSNQSSRNTCVSGVFSCPKAGFSLIFSLIGSTGGNCADKTLHAVGTLLVPGQYAAVWRSLTSARVSNRGHQAAELSCGRLRRCPVIRPATDRGMRDTPYDRRRTLTAAYRAGACLSLDDFPAVSSQRLLQSFFFLICAEAISALVLFLRYRGAGKCRDKNSKQKRRKNPPAVSASYDPSCVCSIVQF